MLYFGFFRCFGSIALADEACRRAGGLFGGYDGGHKFANDGKHPQKAVILGVFGLCSCLFYTTPMNFARFTGGVILPFFLIFLSFSFKD